MNHSGRTRSGVLAGFAAGLATLLLWTPPSFAVNAADSCDGTANDPATCTGRGTNHTSVCMGTLFGGSLNCTANDVRIGRAENVRDAQGQTITSCVEGSTLNFTADFRVELTAQARYDVGLYFATDGDPQADGARGGACSVSKITASNNQINFVNLDTIPPSATKPAPQPTDTCGDIDDTHNPEIVTLTLSAACHAGPLYFNPATGMCQATAPAGVTDPKHCVALPNCTSWRQTGANGVCDSPLDAFPGTTSKCNCDDTFGIPVIVETASLLVDKSVSPTEVPEHTSDGLGSIVHYTVTITNQASFVDVTINTIVDDIYGNLHAASNTNVSSNTCPAKVGTVLAPGGSTSCTFDAVVPDGDFNSAGVHDTVEVCGTDSASHSVCGDDDALVTYTDSTVAPTLAKTATAAANCQLDVTYTVSVTNNSQFDTETLNSLTDDKFGLLTTAHAKDVSCGANQQTCAQVVSTTCGLGGTGNPGALPATIASSQSYSCSFVGRIVSTSCSIRHVNTATGRLTDDDAVTATPSDTAQVNVDVTFPN